MARYFESDFSYKSGTSRTHLEVIFDIFRVPGAFLLSMNYLFSPKPEDETGFDSL